eukprot:scaffold64787_cov66-Phaeocystis_antarctica.AAC.2
MAGTLRAVVLPRGHAARPFNPLATLGLSTRSRAPASRVRPAQRGGGRCRAAVVPAARPSAARPASRQMAPPPAVPPRPRRRASWEAPRGQGGRRGDCGAAEAAGRVAAVECEAAVRRVVRRRLRRPSVVMVMTSASTRALAAAAAWAAVVAAAVARRGARVCLGRRGCRRMAGRFVARARARQGALPCRAARGGWAGLRRPWPPTWVSIAAESATLAGPHDRTAATHWALSGPTVRFECVAQPGARRVRPRRPGQQAVAPPRGRFQPAGPQYGGGNWRKEEQRERRLRGAIGLCTAGPKPPKLCSEAQRAAARRAPGRLEPWVAGSAAARTTSLTMLGFHGARIALQRVAAQVVDQRRHREYIAEVGEEWPAPHVEVQPALRGGSAQPLLEAPRPATLLVEERDAGALPQQWLQLCDEAVDARRIESDAAARARGAVRSCREVGGEVGGGIEWPLARAQRVAGEDNVERCGGRQRGVAAQLGVVGAHARDASRRRWLGRLQVGRYHADATCGRHGAAPRGLPSR